MNYVSLGNTGLRISRLCLGCMSYGPADPDKYLHGAWTLDEEQSRPFIRRALERGINFFDTADVYGLGSSEKILGRALRDFASRDDVVVATKVGMPMGPSRNERGLSRKHVLAAIDASLKRLGMDYVDLYQIHRWDDETPIEETMEALHEVVVSGKARYIGASSMFAWQFAKAQRVAQQRGWHAFVSMQPQYNLVYREDEREMIPLCRDLGVGIIPWSPLARGRLSGRRADGQEGSARSKSDKVVGAKSAAANQAVVDRLLEVSAARGTPPAQTALAWVLSRPGISAPIVGATRPEHLEAAFDAERLVLSSEEILLLEQPYEPGPVQGFR